MNQEFTDSERWEHYREEMPGGAGLTIYFQTVRIAGGENIFRCHDERRAKVAASAPDLLAALVELCGPDASYVGPELRIPFGSHAAAISAMATARAALLKAKGSI